MKVLLTGSSGRIGRAIHGALSPSHEVIGVDRVAFSTTQVVGDCADADVIEPLLEGTHAVIHTAGPHAPHVGIVPDAEFERVNIEGTARLARLAKAAGIERFVYTSTTALYGHAIEPGACTWVDEETVLRPRTVYHRTNLAAEALLEEDAAPDFTVRVLRMSRCFPEAAPLMAMYRLHRGVDARDVGSGHARALRHEGPAFDRFILSGETPFSPSDCERLSSDLEGLVRERVPQLAAEFDHRGWSLPATIDRIYDSAKARGALGWAPRWGWSEVLAQADRDDLEVLPARS